MKFIPKLTGVVLSAAIMAQSVPFVYAAEESIASSELSNDIQVSKPEYATGNMEADSLLEPVTEDDPEYHKYLENNDPYGIMTMSALWGADSLTHQNRFSGISKVYGIDVSYYQGNIDWKKVKNSGVEFVIIRVGYRGYGSAGTLVEDPKFKTYLDGAAKAGLKVGVYFYTQAITTAEAQEEAKFVLDRIKGYSLQMPVYYDIESVDYDTGRLDSAGLSKAQKTALCTAFCDTIIKSGYSAGVYANYTWLNYYIDGAGLGKKYPIWLAHYTSNTNYDQRMDMWQYSGSGTVSGISAYTDVNVWYSGKLPLYVSDLISVANTSTSNSFAWNGAPDATGYEVYQGTSPSDPKKKKIGDTKNTYFTNSNKSTGTMYKYMVRAYSDASGKRVYGDYSEVFTTCTLPANISKISASARGTSVTISWDKVSKATDYIVEHYVNGAWKQVGTTSSLSYKVNGITQNGVNKFRVKARRNYSGVYYNGGYTYVNAEVTDIPSTVTGIRSTSNTSTSNTITWNASTKAEGYEIYQWIGTTDSYKLIGTTTSTKFTNSKKTSGTMYRYKVRAFNNVDGQRIEGAYSSEFTTCTLPANVSFSICSTDVDSITLNWNKGSKATGYQVEMYTNGTWKTLSTLSGTSYTASDLSQKTAYRFRVRAIRNYNYINYYGDYTEKDITIRPANTPEGLSSSVNTSSSNTITWKSMNGVSGYSVYQWIGTTDSYKKLGDTAYPYYTNSGKSSGTMYTYRVKAYYVSDNVMQYSKPAQVVTCTLPANVTVKTAKRSGSNISLAWNKVSKATGYEIYVKSGSSWKKLTTTSGKSYTAKNLSGTKTFRIRAYRKYNGVNYYGAYTEKTVK
ncbi:GH25 family lysozyme [uncultured Ruminococcus sp.]|uniref:GH25 family lysozyme n=1 Tax=uncultured Ruminococcus sp. TaxID=165186 RepID=UPI002670A6DA|nr:GH25 family lysozyme [uncultured Ruminococcus sp.]